MCGRFVRYTPVERFAGLFHAQGGAVEARASYNIAPSARILVARNTPDGQRELALLKWGLVPAWSDAPKTEYSTINARAETVAEKPAYRSAFRHRRCLIAADGFYEWRPQPDGHKQPYIIHLANDEPFAFAGIWEHWERDGKPLDSCSILVTEANALMRSIHDRMPVILPPESYAAWMDPGITEPARLQPLLRPYPAEKMAFHPVGTSVNSPRNDGRDLLEPVSLSNE
jgi:putative SOS response-associated peptidase YedK